MYTQSWMLSSVRHINDSYTHSIRWSSGADCKWKRYRDAHTHRSFIATTKVLTLVKRYTRTVGRGTVWIDTGPQSPHKRRSSRLVANVIKHCRLRMTIRQGSRSQVSYRGRIRPAAMQGVSWFRLTMSSSVIMGSCTDGPAQQCRSAVQVHILFLPLCYWILLSKKCIFTMLLNDFQQGLFITKVLKIFLPQEEEEAEFQTLGFDWNVWVGKKQRFKP